MIRYISILLIVLSVPICSSAQSISIDSSTLKDCNYYLIKGAKARELLGAYKLQRKTDSAQIVLLDSIITDLEFGICEIEQDNKIVKERFLTVTIYSILITIFYLFK